MYRLPYKTIHYDIAEEVYVIFFFLHFQNLFYSLVPMINFWLTFIFGSPVF
jgi:hypothetical protein